MLYLQVYQIYVALASLRSAELIIPCRPENIIHNGRPDLRLWSRSYCWTLTHRHLIVALMRLITSAFGCTVVDTINAAHRWYIMIRPVGKSEKPTKGRTLTLRTHTLLRIYQCKGRSAATVFESGDLE